MGFSIFGLVRIGCNLVQISFCFMKFKIDTKVPILNSDNWVQRGFILN